MSNYLRLFEDKSNFEDRFTFAYGDLYEKICWVRTISDRPIVLTSGSFDVIHEGHSLYLEAAAGLGFLVVGVDSDEKIRARKGPGRPIVPDHERVRMVTHQRGVGLVTLKPVGHPRWELIRVVNPDVLVVTEETYTSEEIRQLESGYCGQVKVMPRMATVSTSARLRDIIVRGNLNV